MKVAMFSTYDISGGASRACARLNYGLKKDSRVDVTYFVKFQKEESKKTILLTSKETLKDEIENLINFYFKKNRTSLSDTLFSFSYSNTKLPDLKSFDIINLHWVDTFVSLENLYELTVLNKPIVWTLHDMKAFTGGCHYSSTCEKYTTECTFCPQLTSDPNGLVQKVFNVKKQILENANITIITPSIWLAREAQKSQIFKNKKIDVIPYGVDTSVFFPKDKKKSKELFGIDEDTIVLSFGVIDNSEKRKGFKELLKAISIIKDKLKSFNIVALLFGTPTKTDLPFNIVHTGHIDNDEKLSYLYSAADIFILPSLEDNLPNTILESLACGTPIIAFDTGGAKDIINNSNGKIVEKGDVEELAKEIYKLICNKAERQIKGENGKNLIHSQYTLSHQANKYYKLFLDLKQKNFDYSKNKNTNYDFDKVINLDVINQYTIVDKKSLFLKDYILFYNYIKDLKDRYIIYGYGTIGRIIQKLFPEKFILFIDMDAKNINLANVKHPLEVKNLNSNKIIISVLGRESEISDYLINELGISSNQIETINI